LDCGAGMGDSTHLFCLSSSSGNNDCW